MQTSSDSQDWSAQARSLRALAIRLVGDSAADDLVQDTWVRAAERGPAGLASPATWLKAVARNLVRDSARTSARRNAQERQAAKPEALPSDVEVLEKLEVLQCVTEELARLPEQYRSTLHARFFEDLSLEEIAQRSGVQFETVRSRQRRGLELLRERLDRRHGGDRSQWLAALVPWLAARAPLGEASRPLVSLRSLAGTQLAALCLLISLPVAFTVWWLRDASHASEPKASANLPAIEAPAGESPAIETLVPERVAAPAPEGHASAVASVAAAKFAGHELCELRGTLVVLDEEGREQRSESGELTLSFGTQVGELEDLELRVARGSWSARVPAGSLVKFSDLRVGERWTALVDETLRTAGPESIELVGRWPAPVSLHVRDAETRLELRDVEVRLQTRGDPSLSHPGDGWCTETLISKGASPLSIEARERSVMHFAERGWSSRYFVHAPGYAWTSVALDFTRGGERVVELVPGGELEVTVENAGAQLEIRVSREATAPHAALAAVSKVARNSVFFTDLAPGSYRVAASAVDGDVRVEYASQPLELAAGARVSIELTPISRVDTAEPAKVSGTLRAHEPLPDEAQALSWVRIEHREGSAPLAHGVALTRLPRDAHDPLLWRWEIELVAGTWEVGIQSLGFAETFTVAPGEERQVEVEVPRLARIQVCVVDALTGAPLEAEQVTLNPRYAGNTRLRILAPDASSRAYAGIAPASEYWLSVRCAERRPYSELLTLQAGENALTAELAIARGIDLAAFDAETREPLDLTLDHDFRIEFAGQEFRSGLHESNGASVGRLYLGDAGRYTLRFQPRAGFETPESVEVDVPALGFVELQVPFVRTR